jgi:hypothetical protein
LKEENRVRILEDGQENVWAYEGGRNWEPVKIAYWKV